MKAITTKFHGPTNTRESRISASDSDGNRIFVNFDHAVCRDSAHNFAAVSLCNKMGWKGELIGGGNGAGSEVYVFTGRHRDRAAFVSDPFKPDEALGGAKAMLKVAAAILRHPDVTALRFAIRSEVIADRLEKLADAL